MSAKLTCACGAGFEHEGAGELPWLVHLALETWQKIHAAHGAVVGLEQEE